MSAMQETIGNIFSGVISGTVGVAFWITLTLIVIGCIGGLIFYFLVYKKRFDIKVKVRSTRAHDPAIFFDKAAILYDKETKTKYLRLEGLKVDLEIPPFRIFEKTNEGDYIELLRVSEDGFRFLTPAKIDRKYYIKKNGKLYAFADSKQREIESDIYWILGRKQKNKKIVSPEGLLMTLLQYTPHLITLAICFMMIWVIMDKLPEVISVVQTAAEAIKSANQPVVVGN